MSAMGRLAEEYQLTGDEPEILVDAIIDTESAIREWSTYLTDCGRVYQYSARCSYSGLSPWCRLPWSSVTSSPGVSRRSGGRSSDVGNSRVRARGADHAGARHRLKLVM